MPEHQPIRLLVLAAHPDDAELQAGGLLARCAARGDVVRIISVTDGAAGHHQRTAAELGPMRRAEAAASGAVIGAEYLTWDFPDARLEPTLEVRERVIREMRAFGPDLVLTHRTCDYHPDHRAVGQVVQDASYLVTVPLVVPDAPALQRPPVVALMADVFTRPVPLRPDVVLDVSDQVETVLRMLGCHHTQVFEFLPYNWGVAAPVPDDAAARRFWLHRFLKRTVARRMRQFRPALAERVGDEQADRADLIEVYEISEYGRQPSDDLRARLFPTA